MNNKKIMDACRAGPEADGKRVTRAPSRLDCCEWNDDVWLMANATYITATERPTSIQAIRHDFATSITATDHAPASRPPLVNCGEDVDRCRLSSLGFSLGGDIKEWAETWRERLSEQNRASAFLHYFTIPIFYSYICIQNS
jgi:hypothetical protein